MVTASPGTQNTKQQVMALVQQQRFPEARELCTTLCRQTPGDAHAWFLLSAIHGQLGNFKEAEKCSKKVVKLQPNNPGGFYNLATNYQAQGKNREAVEAYRGALKLQPDLFEVLNNLGSLLRSENQLDEALKYLRRAAQLKPDNPIILNNLGLVLKDQGKLNDAIQHYQSALQAQHDYADAHFNLANALQLQGKFQAAISSYQHALEFKPVFPTASISLGKVLLSQGKAEQALEHFQQALRLQPGFHEAHAAIADVYEKQGDYERAHAQLQPLVAQGALPANAAITFATVCRRLGRREEAVPLLEQQLRLPGLPPTLTQELHFSLGDLYNDLEQFDKAFTHYQQANRLRPFPFDEQAQQQQFQCIQETFAAETLPTLARARNTSERPLFIVGMPRSGTSLVEQILASHPQIHGGGELDCMGELLNSFSGRFGQPYPAAVSGLDADALDSLAQAYLEQLDKLSADALRVTDKMPHNFLHLGLIGQLFPHARIIHCQRDPMDTCLSIYFHNFNANHPYASDLTHLGEYYKRYRSLMQHWKQTLTVPILDVQYETLVSDQEQTSRRLIDFCGVDWDDQCLRYYESERLVNTPSYAQVRKPVYRSSIGRWQHYEQYLDPLKQALN